jgi:rhodanese-related sulfurtransferase
MVHAISPQRAHDLLTHGHLQVVDVRETAEWLTGHLPGAKHVPLSELRHGATAALDAEVDGVMFVCAAGVRSDTAARIAAASGIANVYSLSGGTRGWARAGLPLVRE